MIDQILSDINADPRESELTFEMVGLLLSGVVKAAQITADQEMGKMGGTLQDAVAMFRQVLARFPWGNPHVTGTALDYVPLMAQALAYASPEYWLWWCMRLQKRIARPTKIAYWRPSTLLLMPTLSCSVMPCVCYFNHLSSRDARRNGTDH